MRTREIATILVCLSTACGLAVKGTAEGQSSPATEPGLLVDASSTASDGSSGPGEEGDGGEVRIEAGDGCTVLIDDTFSNESDSWERLGSAVFEPGQIALTRKNLGVEVGAIWWKQPLTFENVLHVDVEFTIDGSGAAPGDGIAIGWVDEATPYALGPAGQSFGLCNRSLEGTAVAADSRDGQLLVMTGIGGDCDTDDGVFPANVAGATKMSAELRATSIGGALQNASFHTRNVNLPKTGFLGISAATGGGFAAHIVKSVRVTSCR